MEYIYTLLLAILPICYISAVEASWLEIRNRLPNLKMALRRALGWSEGEVMRPESKPCSRLMRQTAGIFSVGGGLAFWVLCRLHYGPRITVPRSLRWASCGAVSMSATSALLVRLFSPECEPQNIAAFDKPELKAE